MDGSIDITGNAATATVVRQFAPSRIERQLLAQVFQLVCGEAGDDGTSRPDPECSPSRHVSRGQVQAIDRPDGERSLA